MKLLIYHFREDIGDDDDDDGGDNSCQMIKVVTMVFSFSSPGKNPFGKINQRIKTFLRQ